MRDRPVVVLSKPDAQCATFFWPERPDCYVGYRFIEHSPEMSPEPLPAIEQLPVCAWGETPAVQDQLLAAGSADPWGKGWSNSYDEGDEGDPVQLAFRSFPDGAAWARGLDNGGDQTRVFHFKPVEDGVAMWMTVRTRVPLPGAFCVQQCLRFTGRHNAEWRQRVARVPSLSELDLQAGGHANETLTHARRPGGWISFPVQHTRRPTRAGRSLAGEPEDEEVLHGLIVRESADRRYASGMYWERTAYVSNRHEADCLHAAVDFGPLQAGESRTVRGRFYFVEGSKEDLLAAWRKEFSENNNDPCPSGNR